MSKEQHALFLSHRYVSSKVCNKPGLCTPAARRRRSQCIPSFCTCCAFVCHLIVHFIGPLMWVYPRPPLGLLFRCVAAYIPPAAVPPPPRPPVAVCVVLHFAALQLRQATLCRTLPGGTTPISVCRPPPPPPHTQPVPTHHPMPPITHQATQPTTNHTRWHPCHAWEWRHNTHTTDTRGGEGVHDALATRRTERGNGHAEG